MSSNHISTLRIIGAELSPFEEVESSFKQNHNVRDKVHPNVRSESKSQKDFVSVRHVERDNPNVLPKTLLKKEPQIKADQTEHFKQYEKNLNFVAMWGKPLGLALDYKWNKNNPRYLLLNILILFTCSEYLYTQCLHISNGEFERLLEVFAMYGIAYAGVGGHVVNFRIYKEITALIHFTRKICLQNITGSRADRLKPRLNQIYRFLFLVSIGSFGCIGVFIGYPVKAFVIDGELVSIMPIEIIFLDQTTLKGFLIANAIMSILGIWTLFLVLFCITSFFIVVGNYSIQIDMIEEDIKELDGYWSGENLPFKGYQRILLRSICQKQQDMNNYMNKINEIYGRHIFLFFVFSYLSQIVCLFEIVTRGWISGYGIAFGIFICQTVFCYAGTSMTIENDRLYSALQQFKWYNCDLRSQKIYLQLLTSAMDDKELWIGPLAPLNVISEIQILKSIYSYYTILMDVA